MATRTIATRIAVDGETAYKRAIGEVNQHLRNLKAEMGYVEEQFKDQTDSTEGLSKKSELLRQEIEQQTEKIRSLEQAVEDAAEEYGDTHKKTDEWRGSLIRAKTDLLKMQRELQNTEDALKRTETELDDNTEALDDFGRESGNISLKEFTGQLSNLKNMIVGGAIATGIKEAADAILDLEASTREYRQIMGTLEVSSQQAGYSADETQEAYQRLYGVLGDPQATATTIANLQGTGLEQEKLMTLIDQTVGAWGRYGDSIPIEGLAESINETIKTGEVTGALADVLNWGTKEGNTFGVMLKDNIEFTELSKEELDKLTESQKLEYEATKNQYESTQDYNEAVQNATTAEDYFNIALQNSQSEAERADQVLRTLSEMGLAEAGESWRDLNEDIIDANESQARMEEAMGKLGEAVSPAADAIRNVAAGAIEYFADVVDSAIGLVQNFLKWWDKFVDTEENARRRNEQRTGVKSTAGYATGGNDNSAWMNGSFASGLPYVPWDGYRAELHQGEAVLRADEAAWWRSMKAAPSAAPGVTAADLQAVTAAAVNAINLGHGQERIVIEAKWIVNGREFYADTIDDLRAVNRSNPEVTDDR